MAIDWGATGSMMQGFAAWAGAGAVIYAAQSTFGSWKRQKQEERRMEAAERILTLAYRLQWSLGRLRTRQDYRELHEPLDPAARLGDMTGPEMMRARRAAAATRIRERIRKHESTWDEIFAVSPLARAFFPEVVNECLLNMRARYDGYCSRVDSYGSTRDEGVAHYAEQIIFEPFDENFPYMDEPAPHDAFAERMKEEVSRIEGVLLPIIRRLEGGAARKLSPWKGA